MERDGNERYCKERTREWGAMQNKHMKGKGMESNKKKWKDRKEKELNGHERKIIKYMKTH